jgi:hypothetical protein
VVLKPDIGEAKGPQYDVARAIKSFLGQMAEGGIKLGAAVIKELMQNADDAGAKEMSVFLDERPVPPRFDDNYGRPFAVTTNYLAGLSPAQGVVRAPW